MDTQGAAPTRRRKSKAGKTARMPDSLALITCKTYGNALTYNKNGCAYLRNATIPDNVEYVDGDWRYTNGGLAEHKSLYTANGGLADIPTLWGLYSVLWNELKPRSRELTVTGSEEAYELFPVRIYLPDYLKMTGRAVNMGANVIDSTLAKMEALFDVVGLFPRNGGASPPAICPVLSEYEYDEAANTVKFRSPYMVRLIIAMLREQAETRTHFHSYLVSPAILKERNRPAIEIAAYMVRLIVRAGNNPTNRTVHTRCSAILEHCTGLSRQLDGIQKVSEQNNRLRRAFEKAWELLPKHTYLQAVYRDITLPMPDLIPTMATLDTTIVNITHNGRKRGKTVDDNSLYALDD